MMVVPFTNNSDYRFKLSIAWSSGSRKDVAVVGDLDHEGRPFRVVSGYQSEKYIIDQDSVARPFNEPKLTDPFEEITDAAG